MSLWRQLTHGLRVLWNRKSTDKDIDDEVGHYLEEATAAHLARGLPQGEARRAARLELGNATVVREEVRGYGWENTIDNLVSDFRYAVRRLLQKPGFTTASLLTLTLGIGATAAMFSVINGVLLKPLPYPDSDRIIALRHTAPGIHIEDMNMAASLYYTYREEGRAFQDVALWQTDTATITGVAEPEEAPILSVTNRFLPTLRVEPAIGRAFTASDDDPGGARVVMLTDGYWKSRFGGDRSILGRRILMDGDAYEVIGVMPPSFQFLDVRFSMLLPFRMQRSNIRLISFCCQGIARLKPGVTLTEANADVARMLALAPEKFAMNPGFSATAWKDSGYAPRLRPLKDILIGDLGKTLWVLMGTVGIVLLIACANVANLLLVRADGRQQELAIRAALGAGWGRIAGELLLESLILGITGGALGLALAYGAVRVLATSELAHLPRIHDISIDPAVFGFTLAISLASAVIFGLVPVLKYARPQASNALRSGGRSLSQSKERERARGLLVIVQVALAVILLVGSGLMIRTFQALRHVDPGFAGAHELETFRISIPDSQVKEPEGVIRMQEAILHKIEAVPRVSAVAIASTVPMGGGGANDPIYAQDKPSQLGAVPAVRLFKYVSPGYFSTIGARLIAGRELTWAETYNRTPVALVSENLAREFWSDPRAAIGKRIRTSLKDDWREVIGVVADSRDNGADQKAPSIVYWPLFLKNFESSNTWETRNVTFVVRTPRAGSSPLLRDLQTAVGSVNPSLPLAGVSTLEALYERSLARTSFTLVLLAIAGSMALFLGLVGIYGVISYSVSQRTREIGIRLALWAPLQNVTAVFVRHGLALSGTGAFFGLIAALVLGRLMRSLLYEVSPLDPLTYFAASAGLILAAALASYLPARSATKVDPSEALRAE